eukprot:CAMPEP_0196666834 /NCGR_PEP_ID=MMETSP1086-20130531/64736_1 /TAXON_ID=77921 /ORGANISM="Cyanoptyche  gloeocystis , Strain SAG4.97" /LENGTH=422 /DNA_ID=CAMNT_0042004081 /DNA_START=107 /DNA_END=1375 /DNA_ORIENTATION=-
MAFVVVLPTVGGSVSTARVNVCKTDRKGFRTFSGLKATASQKALRTAEAGALTSVDESSNKFFSAIESQTATSSEGNMVAMTMKLKVAVNGFGRIGRNVVRCLAGRKDSNLELVAVNDTGGPKLAAHLLKYDSVLGKFANDVKLDGDMITVEGLSQPFKVISTRNPLEAPWKELGVDIVIEATGVFIDTPGAGKHIEAGAKKVVITAPGKGADVPTYVVGVNHLDYNPKTDHIISNASCTTNCLAPFVKVLDEKFGIIKGTMTTTHSYTGDQRLLDAGHRDLRRARAAAMNIVPTSTGAAKAVALVLPSLKGKLNGLALRVPTPNVSIVDLVVNVEKKTFTDEVNAALKEAAENGMKGILKFSEEPLVSTDYRGTDESSIVDASLTMVMGEDMVKVIAWYDNEWGYSQRVVDLTEHVAANWS